MTSSMLRGHVDALLIGARSMHNTPLLRAAGQSGMTVILKRGMSATYDEWLAAADYVTAEGNRPGHPLRARHPHLRDGDPEHA